MTDLSHNGWLAETLRLTAFATPGSYDSNPTWWADLVGQSPETSVNKPRESQIQEEGGFGKGKLILNAKPDRIDWVYTVHSRQPPSSAENLPAISSFTGALEKLQELLHKWVTISPPATRLAFGAILIQSTNDEEAAYRKLAPYLPSIDIDVQNSTDFRYQINRPRPHSTKIYQFNINRLSKWSVTSLREIMIEIPSGESKLSRVIMPSSPLTACRLELDINTAAEFNGQFNKEEQEAIIEELIRQGVEIANNGDIP